MPALSKPASDIQSHRPLFQQAALCVGCSQGRGVSQRLAVQVHEEVLRLLTASLAKLSAHQLAKYLQATLQHSRKSRKCAKGPLPAHICWSLKIYLRIKCDLH